MNKLIKSTFIVLLCSIAGKILSYIWEASLAAYLGASDEADCLYMMVSIFNILYPILDLGIWKVFMPAYKTRMVQGEKDKANKIANISITFFFAVSLVLVLFLVAFARPLAIIIAPGFSAAKKETTAYFIRIGAPIYLTMAVSSVLGAILQSHEKFFGSQLREIGAHVGKIAFLFVMYRYIGIYAAVIAYIVGSVTRVIVQLPFIDWEWKFRPNTDFKDPDIRQMMKGLPSVSVTAAVAHINTVVDRIYASGASTGAVSYLNYGNKLMNLFSGMISMAIGTATYPTMIQYIAEKQDDKLKTLLRQILNALSYLIIPISFYCVFFSNELVRVAFQRGAFDSLAAEWTARVFVGYCVGMLFTGLSTVVTNVFYGYGDTKITMIITLLGIAINVVLNMVFYWWIGLPGLAYATSAAAFISYVIRFVYLKKYVSISVTEDLLENIKIIVVSCVAAFGTYELFSHLPGMNVYILVVCSAAVMLALYLVGSKLMKVQAFSTVAAMIKKKLPHKRGER